MANLAQPDWLDQPAAIRPGEEFSGERLHSFLRERMPELRAPLELRQFPGGHSNLTYLISTGDQEFVLRRPPFGTKIRSAHDMGREFSILSALTPIYAKAPKPLLFCDDDSVIGAPFYIMERVQGLILRREVPSGLKLPPAQMAKLSQSFIENLVEIHALDWRAAGLADLGHPEGYVARQISGWTERYLKAQTEKVPQMERVARWLGEHQPEESGAALIHNDYKYDNLVLSPERVSEIRAVLDWEMATIGDPLMDLGCTLSYWVDAADPEELQNLRFCPTTLPGNSSRENLVEAYFRSVGRPAPDLVFYYVYGLFKLAVIVQQIYARYARGDSKDARFAGFNQAVAALAAVAERAIKRRSISFG